MNFYYNLLITYILIGVVFASLFYFFIRKDVLKNYFFFLLFGIIGSFLGVFFDTIISFDPLKYIHFFREIFTLGIFWPSVFSFSVLFIYSRVFDNK
ncbi:MAG TPA: hypothetical protein DCO79_10830 [Spirochaeta sp.]|nr:hypothetical protein [Spirochaeta sp.]